MKQLAAENVVLILNLNKFESWNSWRMGSPMPKQKVLVFQPTIKSGRCYDVNCALVFAFRLIGRGHSAADKFAISHKINKTREKLRNCAFAFELPAKETLILK